MRVLVAGAEGQLGRELQHTAPSWADITAAGRDSLDVTQPRDVHRALAEVAHDWVVNAAGYTDGAVLSETAVFAYKCSRTYFPERDAAIKFDDPDVRIDWPLTDTLLSQKDAKAPVLRHSATPTVDNLTHTARFS